MLTYQKTKTRKATNKRSFSRLDSELNLFIEQLKDPTEFDPSAQPPESIVAPLATDKAPSQKSLGQTGCHSSYYRMLATHCGTAIVVGLFGIATGTLSMPIAGAYFAGSFAACIFLGIELRRSTKRKLVSLE